MFTGAGAGAGAAAALLGVALSSEPIISVMTSVTRLAAERARIAEPPDRSPVTGAQPSPGGGISD